MLGTTARLQILTGSAPHGRTAPVSRRPSIASRGAGLDRVEPVTHDPAGLVGLGEVHGVAATGDQGRDAVRHEAGHPERMRGEAGVVRPGQGQNGAGERRQAGPTRAPGCPSRTAGGWTPDRPRCCGDVPSARPHHRTRVVRTWARAARQSTKPSTSPEASSSSAMTSSDRRRRSRSSGSSMPAVTPMKTTPRKGRSARQRHVQGHAGTQRVAEQGARLVADLRPHRLRRRAPPSSAGRPAPDRSRRVPADPPRSACATRPGGLRSGPRGARSG